MTPEAIASATVLALAPFVRDAGVEFAKKVGENLVDSVSRLYSMVKRKLTAHPDTAQALAHFEARPDSQARSAVLSEALIETFRADAAFADEIARAIEGVRRADVSGVLALGERSVAIGRDADNNVIISGDSNQVSRK
jgi:hypothetical protein